MIHLNNASCLEVVKDEQVPLVYPEHMQVGNELPIAIMSREHTIEWGLHERKVLWDPRCLEVYEAIWNASPILDGLHVPFAVRCTEESIRNRKAAKQARVNDVVGSS
jgi:hypothetical protein